MKFRNNPRGNIRFTADVSLNDFGEPSDYVTHVRAEIQQYADDEYDELVETGNVSLIIVRLGDAYERTGVKDAFDESATLFSFYHHVWDDEDDWFVGNLDLSPQGLEILIVDRIYLEPAYRGNGLGKYALQRILDYFATRCELALLKSFPLQFESNYTEGRSSFDLVDFKRSEPVSAKALVAFYEKCGFQKLGEDGYMFQILEHPSR